MVHKFDPAWFNGTIFQFEDIAHMADGWMEFERENLPIPASHFPKSLVIERASGPMPDLFHASRNLFIVSERARAVFDRLAPGQLEFIPVEITKARTGWLNAFYDAHYSIQAFARSVKQAFTGQREMFYRPIGIEPKRRISLRLNLARSYYFINVLGRAQRLLWLQMPIRPFQRQSDGVQRFGLLQDYDKWKFAGRAPQDPLIWREEIWRNGNDEYRGYSEVMIADRLWSALEEKFPGQLHPMRAGGAGAAASG